MKKFELGKHSTALTLLISLFTNLCLGATGNPIAHWTFDDGTATDIIQGNNGTITGATSVTGQSGLALNFDGVDDIVEVPNHSSLQLSDIWCIEVTFQVASQTVPSTSATRSILAKGASIGVWADYGIQIDDNNQDGFLDSPYLELDGPTTHYTYRSTIDVQVGQWHTFTASFNQGSIELFLDGVPAGTFNHISSAIQTSTVPLYFGKRYAGNYSPNHDRPFPGMIDDVLITPEPASLSLLALGGLALARRRHTN